MFLLLLLSSLLLLAVAPLARTAGEFFGGRRQDRAPGQVALVSSLVISWLFAKSLTNAADLGLVFGLVGGVAYAAYYLSFAVAGWVIHGMRTRGGFASIHDFLGSRFGRGAVLVFSLLICVRLFNEVWSNTMVIGSYFGAPGEMGYVIAVVLFTVLTLAYSLKGGMSSSILTDVIQMVFFGVLLAIVLGAILPKTEYDLGAFLGSGTWGWATGGNLLLVALLQSFSYPFHDPVMTDRGFLSDPVTTRRSFYLAAVIGFGCIVLFSFVGVYGGMVGAEPPAPVSVATLLGTPLLLVMNFIMVTSAASTLDSTFTSFAKLVVVDLRSSAEALGAQRLSVRTTSSSHIKVNLAAGAGAMQEQAAGEDELLDVQLHDTIFVIPKVFAGRLAMVVITLLGTVPIFFSPAILSATTVSGAMVMGLGPVFCLWWVKAPPLSFYLSVGFGLLCGVALVAGWWPEGLHFTQGKYADLLSVTAVEFVGCLALYFLGLFTQRTSSL